MMCCGIYSYGFECSSCFSIRHVLFIFHDSQENFSRQYAAACQNFYQHIHKYILKINRASAGGMMAAEDKKERK